eukprot:GGOE01057314.1.p2 GENE.GGOE01057314.1~~GGOE01057314.1.p2  ORF type:complete len:113 (+),score=8.60 GGOE01057314.1:460-798(+)
MGDLPHQSASLLHKSKAISLSPYAFTKLNPVPLQDATHPALPAAASGFVQTSVELPIASVVETGFLPYFSLLPCVPRRHLQLAPFQLHLCHLLSLVAFHGKVRRQTWWRAWC